MSRCGSESGVTRHYERGETPCDDCREARRAARKRRREQQRGYAGEGLVDATPAREAIHQATQRGGKLASIARAGGLSPKTVSRIRTGETKSVLRSTSDAILQACGSLDLPPPGARAVDAARARLVCLLDEGATWRWLASQVGCSFQTINDVIGWHRSWVSEDFAARVDRVHRDVLSGRMHPPRFREARVDDPCIVDGCRNRRCYEPGLCTTHYKKQRKQQRDSDTKEAAA